jgi:fungal nitric oxide reductase
MQNRAQFEELKANPTFVPDFVTELCRYHTGSALAMKRVAKVDIELGGQVSSLIEAQQSMSNGP